MFIPFYTHVKSIGEDPIDLYQWPIAAKYVTVEDKGGWPTKSQWNVNLTSFAPVFQPEDWHCHLTRSLFPRLFFRSNPCR